MRFGSFLRRKSGGYVPIKDIEDAFSCDNRKYDAIGNDIILVFDVPNCVARAPVLDIVDEIRAQSQGRARSGTLLDMNQPTESGFSRFLVTLQETRPGEEFEVLQDHLSRCVPAKGLPFTFERMTIELVYHFHS